MKHFVLFLIVFIVAWPSPSSGQIGTTGLSFLKIGVGGRSLALGEAYTANGDDISGAYYNPAALIHRESAQILLTHREWIEDTRTEYLGAMVPIGRFAFGLSVNTTSVRNIEIRTIPGPAEGTFSARNAAVGVSIAYNATSTLSLGVTGKYLYEKIFVEDASGIAFDLGALYNTPWDVAIGLSVSNIGSMSALKNDPTELPTLLRLGGAYEIPVERLNGTIAASADIVSVLKEERIHAHAGLEFGYQDAFAVRVGYQTGYDAKSFTTGIGIRYGLLAFDYAFIPMYSDLGSTHTFSLTIDIPS